MRPSEPEAELLFELVRTANNHADAESRIEAIARSQPDWLEVLNIGLYHGMLPQLYLTLNRLEADVPDGLLRELGTRYQNNVNRNLRFAQHLHEFVEMFRANDIKVIPYKGPVLSQYTYDGLDQRSFDDLDILVEESDVLRARELLLDRGFEQTNARGIDAATLVDETVFKWEREFRFTDGDVPVELRYGLTGRGEMDRDVFTDLWNRRTDLSLAGRPIPALSAEDRALLLLRHGTKHGWCRLSWVYDMAVVMQRELNWSNVFSRASQYGWETAALLGMAVVSEISGVDLPTTVRQKISENTRAKWGAPLLTTRFQDDPTGDSLDIDPWTVIFFLHDSPSGSVRELLTELFAPRISTHVMLPLPTTLYPLYYLLRPIELGRRFVSPDGGAVLSRADQQLE